MKKKNQRWQHYLKCLALERKRLGRKEILSAIKNWASPAEVRDAVQGHKVLVDPAVDNWGHVGRDSDIVVGHIDVR